MNRNDWQGPAKEFLSLSTQNCASQSRGTETTPYASWLCHDVAQRRMQCQHHVWPRLVISLEWWQACRPAAKHLALCCLALTPPTGQDDAVEGQRPVEPDIRICVKQYTSNGRVPRVAPKLGTISEDRIKERAGSFWGTRNSREGNTLTHASWYDQDQPFWRPDDKRSILPKQRQESTMGGNRHTSNHETVLVKGM